MHLDVLSVPAERAPTGATNAYLLGRREALLIDPGARSDSLDTVVAARDVATIAVTDTHPDHAGAVADYAAETGATVCARRPDRFAAATGVNPDRRLREGATISTDSGAVSILDLPGKAPDGVGFALPDGSVVCGDVAVAEGPVVVGDEGDVRACLATLRRLYARDPPRLHPSHGPAIDDSRTACRQLLAHCRERERRVLAAVENGAGDIDAVVDAAYDESLDGIRDPAAATVRAHLRKLDRERRVDYDPESGRVVVC